jgi:hypothetical protein
MCTSAIAKAIQKMRRQVPEAQFNYLFNGLWAIHPKQETDEMVFHVRIDLRRGTGKGHPYRG